MTKYGYPNVAVELKNQIKIYLLTPDEVRAPNTIAS
jgi:hypothetical protein